MKLKRRCVALTNAGEPCGAAPLLDGECCRVHDPAHREEMAEWRRMGGMNRRREASVATIYDVGNIQSVPGLWRVVQIAVLGTLALENSVPRNRTLLTAVTTGTKLIEVGDHEERLTEIEAVLGHRLARRGKRT